MRFYQQSHRFYCGIDLHARTMYLCVRDQAGNVLRGTRRHRWDHDPTETAELLTELRHTEDEREERGLLFPGTASLLVETRCGPPASLFLTALAWIGRTSRVGSLFNDRTVDERSHA